MNHLLNKLCNYGCLDEEQAYVTLSQMMDGNCDDNQIAAFLTAYMMRKPSVAELSGFRRAMMEHCVPIHLSDAPSAVDIVGTGGDGKNSFNISTLSAIVTAAAGFKVIKHGNYGASSMAGSSNVLEHLGYRFTNDQSLLNQQLEAANICFLHAPFFHPGMKRFAQVRKSLGMRSFFNLLGPLTNPAKPGAQLLGVSSLEIARTYHYLLQGSEQRFAIVHSLDGYDEISLTANFKLIINNREDILSPGKFRLPIVHPSNIDGGGNIKESAAIFLRLLEGNGSPEQVSVIAINSGLAIHLVAPEISIEEGMERAREALCSQQALQTFHQLISTSHEYS